MPTKIALVNYINSSPFKHGLSHYKAIDFELQLLVPAACAQAYKNREVDIALVPVGALHDLDDYEIVTDFCIGSDGEVRTVCIFSQTPLAGCHTLYLDMDSRTSVLLAKLIVEKYLNINLIFKNARVDDITIDNGEAVLMIGDKVFSIEDKYEHKLDLGETWKTWHDLPFAFAVWIARKGTNQETIQHVNRALTMGITYLPTIINDDPSMSTYYSKNISYFLSEKKKEAIKLFLELSSLIK